MGSPSPSSVAPAAGPGVPNAACSLASAAYSTSAAVIGLSSSVFASLDDNFEGLAATRDTPPMRIMSSSFPSSLDIQQRFFAKCTSHHHGSQRPDWPSRVQHSVNRRDLSNLCVVAHLPCCFISALDAVNNRLVLLDMRSPFSWPWSGGHT